MYLPIAFDDRKWGNLGLIAQSGGLSNLIINGFFNANINISKAFSVGNAMDIDLLDVLNYLKDDPETHIIAMYIEGLKERTGGRFLKILSECKKPVLIIKAGKTEMGSKAAVTHTAAVVGDYNLWQHAIKQAGGILLDTLEDLINTAKYLSSGLKSVNRACVASLSGGYGVIMTDVLMDFGIEIPDYQPETTEKLAQIINRVGTSYKNPIDLAGFLNQPVAMNNIFRTILEDKKVDGIVFDVPPFYLPQQKRRPNLNLSNSLGKLLMDLKTEYNKSIIVIIQDIGFTEKRLELKNNLQLAGIPVYTGILHVARTLTKINAYFKRING
jgi:acyl-CoA synthetase (NDP forming)